MQMLREVKFAQPCPPAQNQAPAGYRVRVRTQHAQTRHRRLRLNLAAAVMVARSSSPPCGRHLSSTARPQRSRLPLATGRRRRSRTGEAITLDAVPCDAATVPTTDAIVVNSTGIPAAVVIDLSGGDFAPGLTTESDGGNSEIEFSINLPAGSPLVRIAGGTGSDNIVAGAAGLNLNAVEAVGDPDVLIVGLPTVVVEGGAGSDVLSVTGGSGPGGLHSSVGRRDRGRLLIGASGGNTLNGGDGSDTVDYTAATQLLDANLLTGVIQHVAGRQTTSPTSRT
jgi:hypothetical protein